ncbi:MAG: aminotransferase class I/II-fold pyridoxal phosphate-dependent enzyme [Clostridia bacterium]
MLKNDQLGFATRQIHTGSMKIPGIAPLATPIFQTSTFVFENAEQGAKRFSGEENGYIYTRLGNPNANLLAEKLANLEGAEAGFFASSGMGAITSVLWTALKAGDHILSDKTLYGCTFSFLKHGISRNGVEYSQADFTDLDAVKAGLRENTKVVYFESPSNPDNRVIDIECVSKLVHAYNSDIKVIVDNTYCTPYIQRPLSLGADVVVHSATKYLNGHGDVVAGAAVGKADFINECVMFGVKDMTGAVLGPFEAFLINRGMKTLDIRVEKHSKNAMQIAQFLEAHPNVDKVMYPGLPSSSSFEITKKQMALFGGMIAFTLKTDRKGTEDFINSLSLCTLAVSLGDAETLIEHPASMTHSTYSEEELEAVGISPALIRLSVGLEDAKDIIADLSEALDRIK